MSTFLEKAMPYLDLGWPVIPQSRKKVPLIRGWTERRSYTDIRALREWSQLFPAANVALVTGRASGIMVIDLDTPEAVERFEEIRKVCGVKPGPAVITRRGRHLYFRALGFVKNRSPSMLGRGIDIRGDNGLATLPPSVHESGHVYEWDAGRIPTQLPHPTPALMRMIAGIDPYRDDKVFKLNDSMTFERALQKLRSTAEGGRNRALYNAGCVGGKAVHDGQMTEFEVFRQLQSAAADVGLTRIEAIKTIKSGVEDGQKLR